MINGGIKAIFFWNVCFVESYLNRPPLEPAVFFCICSEMAGFPIGRSKIGLNSI